ncbi:unnamed protein product [Adineta steineri]|uniref:Uncharacterized protein n=2 Tax=Adineta steineri TaxID=433720 RepID=A0A814WMW7_9BILA|nr:unnamed protein product [Adineta steineri]
MATYPRTYRIHHKFLSSNHKFEIDNGTDEILYTVRATLFPTFDKFSICETSGGKELIKIQREDQHLHLTYNISAVMENDSATQHLATVRRIHGRHEHHLHGKFEIDSIYGVYKLERNANRSEHEFKIITGEKTVVDVTHFSKLENIYNVEINSDEGGDIFLLSLAITLSCIYL